MSEIVETVTRRLDDKGNVTSETRTTTEYLDPPDNPSDPPVGLYL
jgi:hypothetical protein